ncbi:hypothetical protein GCM10023350_17220 [Nocardioides endophyticus]|uniref:Uncharacterized protein n=1 Tax=Nocardioides endophyticus TaxID=1353775 RepID=A0ABP8YQ57_9ACTN
MALVGAGSGPIRVTRRLMVSSHQQRLSFDGVQPQLELLLARGFGESASARSDPLHNGPAEHAAVSGARELAALLGNQRVAAPAVGRQARTGLGLDDRGASGT